MAVRVLKVWSFRPQTHVVDVLSWDDTTTTIDYATGQFRERFTEQAARVGSVKAAFDALTGWSNGYIGIYPPGAEPWADTTT